MKIIITKILKVWYLEILQKKMIKRYKQLYAELKLIEHQLKEKCAIKHGREVAFNLVFGRDVIVSPETFEELLGGRHVKGKKLPR